MRLGIHERQFMNDWVKKQLRKSPRAYWFRIPDSETGIKPFDGILIVKGRAIAIEFKVWREKGPFKWSCVRAHQLRELLRWKAAGGVSWVIVYHEQSEKVFAFIPTRVILDEAIKVQSKDLKERACTPSENHYQSGPSGLLSQLPPTAPPCEGLPASSRIPSALAVSARIQRRNGSPSR
jgi:hypothetical protein